MILLREKATEQLQEILGRATDKQIINMAEWVLNGHPFLDGWVAKDRRIKDGVP